MASIPTVSSTSLASSLRDLPDDALCGRLRRHPNDPLTLGDVQQLVGDLFAAPEGPRVAPLARLATICQWELEALYTGQPLAARSGEHLCLAEPGLTTAGGAVGDAWRELLRQVVQGIARLAPARELDTALLLLPLDAVSFLEWWQGRTDHGLLCRHPDMPTGLWQAVVQEATTVLRRLADRRAGTAPAVRDIEQDLDGAAWSVCWTDPATGRTSACESLLSDVLLAAVMRPDTPGAVADVLTRTPHGRYLIAQISEAWTDEGDAFRFGPEIAQRLQCDPELGAPVLRASLVPPPRPDAPATSPPTAPDHFARFWPGIHRLLGAHQDPDRAVRELLLRHYAAWIVPRLTTAETAELLRQGTRAERLHVVRALSPAPTGPARPPVLARRAPGRAPRP